MNRGREGGREGGRRDKSRGYCTTSLEHHTEVVVLVSFLAAVST